MKHIREFCCNFLINTQNQSLKVWSFVGARIILFATSKLNAHSILQIKDLAWWLLLAICSTESLFITFLHASTHWPGSWPGLALM